MEQELRSARWGDVKEAHVTGLLHGKLHLEYRQGSKETYWRIPKDAAKKIQLLLDVLLPASAGDTSAGAGDGEFLPGVLCGPLRRAFTNADNCGLKFKDGKTLLLHALLVPGGCLLLRWASIYGEWRTHASTWRSSSSMIIWATCSHGRGRSHAAGRGPANQVHIRGGHGLPGCLLWYLTSACQSRWREMRIRNFIPE